MHVSFGGRSLVSLTREISKTGLFFFADPAPDIGEGLRITLHPDGHASLSVNCVVRYILPGVGAGVEIGGQPDPEVDRFRGFVEDQARSAKAWQLISGFVRSAIDGRETGAAEYEQKEVIDVGENGEAYRVFFERYPPIAPDRTSLAEHPEALLQAQNQVLGVSSETVGIKLNARDRLRRVLLGQLRGGGYVAVVPPPTPSERFVFYTLSGREQIVIKEGDRAVYPFFTSADLARIKGDAVRHVPVTRGPQGDSSAEEASISSRVASALARAQASGPSFDSGDSGEFRRELVQDLQDSVRPSGPSHPSTPKVDLPSLSRWTPFGGSAEQLVIQLFELLDAETRVYNVGDKTRLVRLLRNLTAVVRSADGESEEGILLHDGKRVCILVGLKTREMHIRPIGPGDEIRLPTW